MKKRIINTILIAIGFFIITIVWARTIGFTRQEIKPAGWEEICENIHFYIFLFIIIGIVCSYLIEEYESGK